MYRMLSSAISFDSLLRRVLPIALLGALACGSTASADTVWIRSGTSAKELQLPNVKIDKVQGNDLVWVAEGSGRETRRGLDQVSRVSLDDEPPFSTAEEAYDKGDFKGSIDGYRKAISATNRDWVKTRSAIRLVDAGNSSGNLTAAIAGYQALVASNPAAAQSHVPTIPPTASKEDLTAAIEQVKAASNGSGVTPEQQKPLLALLQQLYTANKDTASAGKVLEKLEGVTSAAAGTGGTQDVADASRVKAQVKLNDARAAMAAKNYSGAISAIEENSAVFVDPASQNEALFLLAEAKAATAGSDRNALMDTAIAYMRVAANFANQPNAPHVAESLLKAATIEEKLKPEEAIILYKQVASEYKDSAAGKTAAESAERLAAAGKR